ncbi:MAG: hypothetical protein K2X93_26885 [Candidatus Obscuribacterales bacterium]|nr:hypothetical protein [Candidatus Obscuribacterales bacterium]
MASQERTLIAMKLLMQSQVETDPATRGQNRPRHEAALGAIFPWLALVFVLSMCVRMWFALVDGHTSIVYACDASEYLRDARGLFQLVNTNDSKELFFSAFDSLGKTLSSQEAEKLHNTFAPVKELAIAGPLFPLFILLSHTCLGLAVNQSGWYAPVIMQCLLTSITTVLIAWIGAKAWSKEAGITAGLIAALYPGFIVNSMRMYSESFSCFWLCLVVALTIPVVERRGMFHSVSTGFALAVLQLTRSVMIMVTAIEFLLTLWLSSGKSRVARCAGLLIGMALVFAPWLLFQQLAFGKCSVIVDRVGHYNLFTGTNVATQGWLAFPYPDGRGIEKRSYAELVGKQIKESPTRFARLMLDKPLRLFKFPWNDFRTPIGPLTNNLQVLFHQAVLAFAAIGLTLCTFNQANRDELRLRGLIVMLAALHLVYLMFITVPRYNLTSMPFFILLAAAGIVAVVSSVSSKSRSTDEMTGLSNKSAQALVGSIILAMSVCRIDWIGALFLPLGLDSRLALILLVSTKAVFVSLLFIILYHAAKRMQRHTRSAKLMTIFTALIVVPLSCLPIRAHGRWYEWSDSSDRDIKQQIAIPQNKLSAVENHDCYLLVDAQDWKLTGNGGKVSINGIECKSPQLPLMPFAQNLNEMKSRSLKGRVQHYLECEDIYNSLNIAAGGSNLDLRQWFIIPIDKSVMRSAIADNKGILSVLIQPAQNTGSGVYGAYQDESKTQCRVPSIARYSWEKAFYGVEEETGFTDSRYDDKITISANGLEQGHSASALPLSRSNPNIRILLTSRVSADASSSPPTPEIAAVQQPGPSVALIGSAVPRYEKDAIWSVELEIRASSTRPGPRNVPVVALAAIDSTDEKGRNHRYRSPWTPSSIVSPVAAGNVRFAFPLQPSALPGKITSISFQLRDGGVASGREHFAVNGPGRLQPGSLQELKIEDTKLSIRELPANPIGQGYEVF